MTSDPATSVSNSQDIAQSLSLISRYSQVLFKSEGKKLLLILPSRTETEETTDWSEIWQELRYRLKTSEQSWQKGANVHLLAKDQLLDARQLQTIAETLSEVDLKLKWVCTSRRQTAVAAATAGYSVEQQTPDQSLGAESEKQSQSFAEPLYLQTTVRSGIEIRHPGTVVILGDLNPGGTVIAAGDIFVWGRLRGVAHAGAQGNRECRIMALRMEPTQLRIADSVARAPKPPKKFEPEIAYITPEGIRLAKATNFAKTHSFSTEVGGWTDLKEQQLTSNQ